MQKKYSIADAAEEILAKTGTPLHYQQITFLIKKKCNLSGKTPHMSVRSSLAKSKKFKRTAEGVFALSQWNEFQEIRFAKDIAYDVLLKYQKPIDQVLLGQEILKERRFIGSPKQIAKMATIHDNRFYLDKSKGIIGLVVWNKQNK